MKGSCPFLIDSENRCKAVIARVVYGRTGKRKEYQLLTPFEVEKCRDQELFPKCPDFIRSKKETCLNCGHVYLPEDASKVAIGDKEFSVCPKCGSTKHRR